MPADTTAEPRAVAAAAIGFVAMAVLDSLALIQGLEPVVRLLLLPAFGFVVYRSFRCPTEPFGKGFVPLLRKLYANPSTRPVAVLLDFPYSALVWFIGKIHATGRLATALGAGFLTYFLAALLLEPLKGTPYFAGAHLAGAVVTFGTWRAFQWGASNVLTTVAAFALRAALVYVALVSVVKYEFLPGVATSDRLFLLYSPRNPPNGYILAACALVSAFFFWSRYATAPYYYAPRPRRDNIRDRGMTTLEEARQRLTQLFGPNLSGVIWGHGVLPDKASTAHFWLTGAPDSGGLVEPRLGQLRR